MRVALIYRDALASGGYPRDARWLAGALARLGVDVTLVAARGSCRDGLRDVTVAEPSAFDWSADVIHVWGGVFSPQLLLPVRRVRKMAPTVISPLANLMPGHLERHALKKRAYLVAFRHGLRNWEHVAHFLAKAEERASIDLMKPRASFQATVGLFPAPAPKSRSGSGDYLLFLGRNDIFQKGIDVLLRGYALAVSQGLQLPLVIAGKPWRDSERQIERLIRCLRLRTSVERVGAVTEAQKWELLSNARCLVFLSRWDGPPRPVREALTAGTPVLVSAATNMGDLVRNAGAGTQLESHTTPDVAQRLIETQDRGLVARWELGVADLCERLTWERVASEYARGYELAYRVIRGRR